MIIKFGKTTKGEETNLYTLRNKNDIVVTVSDYGATLVQILVPDKYGKNTDVVLGYDDAAGYEAGGIFLGATVGRSANRIGTASFLLGGSEYKLTDNDNGNNLHSGNEFYSKRMWNTEDVSSNKVVFSMLSRDKDQGYPGNAKISVCYELSEDNALKISYHAISDKDTLFNMTNHSYFNMDGHKSQTLLSQSAYIDADAFTPTDDKLIPTGEIRSVEGTPMDFRVEKEVGLDINTDYEPIKLAGGYDHNYSLNGSGYRKVASLRSKRSGIGMDVYTDLPGMQFYTGNFIEKEKGRNDALYTKRQGACFETQYFPDAVNNDSFVSPVFKKDKEYKTVTGYKFYLELGD